MDKTVDRFLECGLLRHGFARLKCGRCSHRGRPIESDDRPALSSVPVSPPVDCSTIPQQGRVEYRTAKGIHRTLDALDWIALLTSHIPNPGEQMNRYYGRYSNASRGQRRPASTPATGKGASPAPDLEESSAAEQFSQQRRRSWARLLRKVYEIDPLECPQCRPDYLCRSSSAA